MRILFGVLIAFFAIHLHLNTLHAQTSENSEAHDAPAVGAPAVKPVANPDLPKTTDDILGRLRGTLQSANQALTRKGNRDADLADLSTQASGVRLEALTLEEKLSPLVVQLQEQLTELGPKPQENEPPESVEIQNKRKELEEQFSRLDGEAKAMRLVAVQALQVERQIISNRRAQFVQDITQHSQSLIDPDLWQKFFNGFDGFFQRFWLLIKDSISVLVGLFSQSSSLLLITITGIAAILLVAAVMQRWVNNREMAIRRSQSKEKEERDVSIRLGGVYLIEKGLIPSLTLFSIFYLFSVLGIFTKRLDLFIFDALLLLCGVIIAIIIGRVFLSPGDTHNRLVRLSDDAAQTVFNTLIGLVVTVTILRLLAIIAIANVSPFEVIIGLNAIMALAVFAGAVAILILVAMDQPEDETPTYAGSNLVRWGYLNPAIWLASIIGMAGLLAGYIAFAEFIAWQIVFAGFIFSTLWVALEIFDQYREGFLNRTSGRWRKVSRASGFSKQTVLQSGVFIFGLTRLTIILATIMILMIPWGYRTGDWLQLVSGLFFGFKIGGLTISISSIVLAIFLFGAGYLATRAIQHWLRQQFLPTTSLDLGLRNSIATIFGYAGIVLAAILGITAAGLNLSNLAIVAGALSVGIGFGLQSIVNNFVSGLILLAERPLKSGDWIITSGGQGTVRNTSVRSTEIETFDGATIIVPNSTLITEPVTNWTHHDKVGRIIIPIGVGYDSDPDHIRELLLSCIEGIEGILETPEPKVYFIDFGADALMFELRAYLKDVNSSLSIKSELRFAMLRRLRKAKIEIPYPQRDIHLKSMPGEASLEKPAPVSKRTVRAKSQAKTAKPATRRRRSKRVDNHDGDE